MKKEFLAVIVARGGSKGIPYKNITPLGGKPLLAWAFDAAKQSKAISRIVCSTEDKKIADVCASLGLEVCPRPQELAQDNSPPYPVMEQVLTYLHQLDGYEPYAVFLVQPTSPFVQPHQFDTAAETLIADQKLAAVQSIVPIPHAFHAYNQRTFINGTLKFAFENERMRFYNKQLKPNFFAWGNIFLIKTAELLRQKTVFPDPCGAFLVDSATTIDIDNPKDLDTADKLLNLGASLSQFK